MTERRVVLDADHNVMQLTIPSGGKLPQDLYFAVADVWVINSKNQILLQKRSENKSFQPGKWAMVGGRTIEGEDARQTIAREFKEEMGIDLDIDRCEKLAAYRTGNVWADIFFTRQDIDLSAATLQSSEVSEAAWFDFDKVDQMNQQGTLFPHRWSCVRGIIKEIIRNEMEER